LLLAWHYRKQAQTLNGHLKNNAKLTLQSCTLRELKASLHLTTFGSTWAISSLLPRASQDDLMQLRVVALFATQAKWHTHSAVAHMTMHNVYLYGQASDGL
jgi:hypothetical protein